MGIAACVRFMDLRKVMKGKQYGRVSRCMREKGVGVRDIGQDSWFPITHVIECEGLKKTLLLIDKIHYLGRFSDVLIVGLVKKVDLSFLSQAQKDRVLEILKERELCANHTSLPSNYYEKYHSKAKLINAQHEPDFVGKDYDTVLFCALNRRVELVTSILRRVFKQRESTQLKVVEKLVDIHFNQVYNKEYLTVQDIRKSL